jgi:hypothetical protein
MERFGDEVDRVAFYTPAAMAPATLGELVGELGREGPGGPS